MLGILSCGDGCSGRWRALAVESACFEARTLATTGLPATDFDLIYRRVDITPGGGRTA
jgi:hypothetical protein